MDFFSSRSRAEVAQLNVLLSGVSLPWKRLPSMNTFTYSYTFRFVCRSFKYIHVSWNEKDRPMREVSGPRLRRWLSFLLPRQRGEYKNTVQAMKWSGKRKQRASTITELNFSKLEGTSPFTTVSCVAVCATTKSTTHKSGAYNYQLHNNCTYKNPSILFRMLWRTPRLVRMYCVCVTIVLSPVNGNGPGGFCRKRKRENLLAAAAEARRSCSELRCQEQQLRQSNTSGGCRRSRVTALDCESLTHL